MIRLRVLAVAQDAVTLQTIERAVAAAEDVLFTTMDMAESIATAASEKPEVAFVDVALEDSAGLALVHHIMAVCPRVFVYAMAPPSAMELGTQAIALGAAGLLVAPPSGDALRQALGDVRARLAEAAERARLEADLGAAVRRADVLERLTRVLGAGPRGCGDASAIAEAFREATGARGVAVDVFGPNGTGSLRLAALGSLTDLPRQGASLREVPLVFGIRNVGRVVLDAAEADIGTDALAEISAATLGGPGASREEPGVAQTRIYSYAYFVDTATREIEMAKRHQRRLAIAVLLSRGMRSGPTQEVEDAILGGVRETDVLTHRGANEFVLLLPETGALGAHSCRRRLHARVEGDRRTTPPTSDRRGPPRMDAVSIGLATFPHDGNSLERLLEVARRRAEDSGRSPTHTLALSSKSLPEIVDSLLACPMLDAGPASPFPLDLSLPAALSLVSSVCREALRAGEATIFVAARTGAGLSSVVRPAVAVEPPRATVHEVDLSGAPGCANAEALVVVAEHGTWTLCGRHEGARFKGVHCADALVADLLAQRLALAGGVRLP
jgi:ActR/RegA family two-component response regulator